MAKAVYRVRVIVEKFTPEFEGQHPWHWKQEYLDGVTFEKCTDESGGMKHALSIFKNIVTYLDAGVGRNISEH